MYKERSKEELIAAFKHAIGAKKAVTELFSGVITKQEFEAKGYKLAKLNGEC